MQIITILSVFDDLNPKGRGTAILEILILMLVAYGLGFITSKVYRKSRQRITEDPGDDYDDEQFDRYIDGPQQQSAQAVESNDRPISDVEPVSNIYAATTPAASAIVSPPRRPKSKPKILRGRSKATEPVHSAPESVLSAAEPAVESHSQSRHVMPDPEPEVQTDEPIDEMAADNNQPDDLTVIEGIGPRISELLTDAGVSTFAELSQSSEEELQNILDAAGPRYRMHDPSTWAQQADYARDGRFDELKRLQDSLDGGRR